MSKKIVKAYLKRQKASVITTFEETGKVTPDWWWGYTCALAEAGLITSTEQSFCMLVCYKIIAHCYLKEFDFVLPRETLLSKNRE